MRRWIGELALLLAMPGLCSAAPVRKAASVKQPVPVVTRLVRLGAKGHDARPLIAISLTPGAVVASGRQKARVWVRPLVDGERLEVNVLARGGLALAAGRRRWEGAARKSTALSEEVTLATAGPGERRLIITATLHRPDGSTISGVEAYVLNPAAAPSGIPPGTRQITLPNGEKVIEIPVKPGL